MKSDLCTGSTLVAAAVLCSSLALGAGQDPHAQHTMPSTQPAAGQPSTASISTVKVDGLVIEQPWSRATPNGAKVGGGYVRITNTGATPDRLIGGSFAASGRVELHDMSVSDGI